MTLDSWLKKINMRKSLYILVFVLGTLLLAPNALAEQMPDHYYDAVEGKSDAALKATLKSIIRKHTVIGYGSGSWEVFYYADRDTVTGLCMDMYCDDWKPFTSPGNAVSGCNIEHSFAKSWWGGAENDAYKDCYHLNPSNSTANSSRSNYPPGIPTKEFKDPSVTGSLRVGKRTHETLGDHFVFEPKDEYKGDFARAYFYMATCYGRDINGNIDPVCSKYNGWRLDNKDVGSKFAMQNDNYLEFQPWLIEVLIAWHRQDPVSGKELQRMNAVSDFQHNRNPFIEYPCLAEYIWGNRKGQMVHLDSLTRTTTGNWLALQDSLALCGCLSDTSSVGPVVPPTPKDTFEVTWMVADETYTEGNPSQQVEDGGRITAMPTDPVVSCTPSSETFVGWTNQLVSSPTDIRPVLYTKPSDFPPVTSDCVYYAVFAHATITGLDVPAAIQWKYNDLPSDWITKGMDQKSKYSIMKDGASVTSPSIDLGALQSIRIKMRTYGGTQYNTVNVTAGGEHIASLQAKNSTLADITWENTGSLSGWSPLVFSSSTTTSSNGPALDYIILSTGGLVTTYSAYTTCSSSTNMDEITPNIQITNHKYLINGHLTIVVNGVEYNALGQRIK